MWHLQSRFIFLWTCLVQLVVAQQVMRYVISTASCPECVIDSIFRRLTPDTQDLVAEQTEDEYGIEINVQLPQLALTIYAIVARGCLLGPDVGAQTVPMKGVDGRT